MSTPPGSTVASRSLLRERGARKEAETLLEQKSRELYDINLNLRQLNAHLEESEIRYRTLVELMPDAIWIHSGGKLVFLNPAALRLFGATIPEQLLGRPAIERVAEEWRQQMLQGTYEDMATAQRKPRCALQIVRLDGNTVEVEFFGCAIRYNDADSVLNVAHDITERRQHEKEIQHQATHDLLTGLPNRALFLDRLTAAIRRAERNKSRLAVMFVDLDKFKSVNDTLGHGAGDELLRNVAQQLRQCVRDSDTVARLGGDEFVLLLDMPSGESAPSIIAERIGQRLGVPMLLAGQQHIVTGSIGISIFPDDGALAEALLRQADMAMYRAKEGGRNSFQFFTREMQSRLDARVALEQGLMRALQRDEFVLHYQPQVDLRSGRIVGIEALLRWQSPELGLVPPLQFIPVAEESNLIMGIGKWVFDKACSTLRAWQQAGVPIVPVAINVAASQFSHQDLDRIMRQVLDEHGLDPRFVELELTESLSMDDPEASIALMQRLKQIGIGMSIDDFGTGYSNLSYLKRFPIDKLKIDQSFTRGLSSDPEDCSIVTAVIRLAHSLGLRALAEGVETEGQLRLLSAQGCDEIQGYYFSRPVPEDEMLALLNSQRGLALTPQEQATARRAVLLVGQGPEALSRFQRLLQAQPYELLTAAGPAEAYELLAGRTVGVVLADPAPEAAGQAGFFQRIRRLYPRTARVLLGGDGGADMLAHAINHGAVFKFVAAPWDDGHMLDVLACAFAHHEQGQYVPVGDAD